MFMRRLVAAAALTVAFAAHGQDESPALGQPATADEVRAWDISAAPDGVTLPAGAGTAKQGAGVYADKCESCHGKDGVGGEGLADPLAGGIGSLTSDAPVKTVGSFWPYATTLFDYTRRAMPLNAPMSLTDDEVYAVSAFVLALNGIIGEDDEMNAETLPKVQMPNRDGFTSYWPAPQ